MTSSSAWVRCVRHDGMRWLFIFVTGLPAWGAVACADPTYGGSGGAGGGSVEPTSSGEAAASTAASGGDGGGSSPSSSTSTTASSATSAATTSSTGSGGPCDTGVAAATDSPICDACSECAVQTSCADEKAAFDDATGAAEWYECVFGAAPCPVDDPVTAVDEWAACVGACEGVHGGGHMMRFFVVIVCTVCEVCPTNCDAAGGGCAP
jgi:hypothetical protein